MEKWTMTKLLDSYRDEEEHFLGLIRIRYYTYYPEQILKSFAAIMTAFNGVEYTYFNYKYSKCVCPICDSVYKGVYPRLEIKAFKLGAGHPEDREYCFFGEPYMFDPGIFSSCRTEVKLAYLKKFLKCLFKYRKRKAYDDIPDEELERVTKRFIAGLSAWQYRVKAVNEKKIEIIRQQIERAEEEERQRRYLKSFLVDRSLILPTLRDIVNDLEEGMSATLKYDEKWVPDGDFIDYSLYHLLTIEKDGLERTYKALIGTDRHYRDEVGLAWVDADKKTNISFIELKGAFDYILRETTYAKRFLDTVWERLQSGEISTEEDVQRVLGDIKRDYKENQHVLKMKGLQGSGLDGN